jgi:hypothetical protein
MHSPPISKRPSNSNSSTQIAEQGNSPRTSAFRGSGPLPSEIQINEPPQDFNV